MITALTAQLVSKLPLSCILLLDQLGNMSTLEPSSVGHIDYSSEDEDDYDSVSESSSWPETDSSYEFEHRLDEVSSS